MMFHAVRWCSFCMQTAFNQHQLNLVSCCVYSAARVLGAAVPFRRINETIALVFPLQDTALFVQADVGNAGALCDALKICGVKIIMRS
jgi:hypothetical protein